MLDGKKHEELLSEFEAFESRMQDEGDRNTARLKRRIKRDYATVYAIQSRIRHVENGLARQQATTTHMINHLRGELDTDRNKTQREMRKMSILMAPEEIEIKEYAERFVHRSKWIAVQVYTTMNTKPVNQIDLLVIYTRKYNLVTMKVANDWSYTTNLFSRSFKTEEDAWSYYERNKDKIFKNDVAWIIGDESEMDVDVDLGKEFDRLFDFRLIYQKNWYNTYTNDNGNGRTNLSDRVFMYDINGNRPIVVKNIEKDVMNVSVITRDWRTGIPTTSFDCILRYTGDRCIEVTCPEGRTKDGKTCFEEIYDAITKGPTDQICVDQTTFFKVKHVEV